ncbi:MAG TPA: hypothetical protein VMS30_06710 [Phycisphaerales bacterium]|jgi:hypothetical protein|nr:hypothetical protein [Phycisphaerales bacterium]
MKRTNLSASLAGTGLLTCAVVALAQTPPPSEPRPNPTPPPQRPQQPPAGQQPPPRQQPPAQRPATGAQGGFMKTPRYAEPLAGGVSANAVQVFADNEFKGEQATLDNVMKSHQAGTLNEFAANLDNSATSLRWHLNPGVLVVLFDEATGAGPQLALWGQGQISDLAKVDFNEKASRWAWYDLGGSGEPRSAGNTAMPHGATALDAPLGNESIVIFDDQQFKGEQRAIAGITGQKAGDLQTLPGNTENSASSLRWSLPEGAVVIFAAEDGGNDNIVIFGEGQIADLGKCDFDNKASRWSWAYIGSPTRSEERPGDPNKPGNQPPAKQPGGNQPGGQPREP